MYRILFVDDDPQILEVNRAWFAPRGYEVTVACTAVEALEAVENATFDCIVMDVVLPDGQDGYSLCEALQGESRTPVLFLTGLAEPNFLYRGFAAGAVDYMTKPYDLQELQLRVEAHIRQNRRAGQTKRLHFPPMTLDLDERQVLIRQKLVPLTSKEFDILVLLCGAPEQAFSAEKIYRMVWQLPDLDATHTVQVHVASMRRKLDTACPEHRFIQTAWGKGYLFVAPHED